MAAVPANHGDRAPDTYDAPIVSSVQGNLNTIQSNSGKVKSCRIPSLQSLNSSESVCAEDPLKLRRFQRKHSSRASLLRKPPRATSEYDETMEQEQYSSPEKYFNRTYIT